MKVLSVQEPYATLIANGVKRIETRSWKTNYRGVLYIHASKSSKKEYLEDDVLRELLGYKPLNFGKIICKCNLVDCVEMDLEFMNTIKRCYPEYLCGFYSVGRYAWILEDVELIDPIEAKGQLGIWNYELEERC